MPTPSPKTLTFSDEVLEILKHVVWDENGLVCRITQKLDRKTYEEVNKALLAMGGVWKSGKIKGHVFESDPRSKVEGLLDSGQIQVDRDGFFETPEPIVDMMIAKAEITSSMSVLEPSAGRGAIAKKILDKTAMLSVIEKNKERANYLELFCNVIGHEFMEFKSDVPFMRILMNPPFENGQDVEHVMHAYDLLNPKGGRIVAIMGEHAFFAEDKRSKEFRDWFTKIKGKSEKLPTNSFKSSGTGVNARIVVINKGKVKK